MKKQPDNTNPKIQKEKPNILIHRWKDTNNPRIVDEEALQVKNTLNQAEIKTIREDFNHEYKEVLGSAEAISNNLAGDKLIKNPRQSEK